MTRRDWIALAALTAIFEALAILFRFGFGMESTHETSALAAFTFGLRIHHGYLGVPMIIIGVVLSSRSFARWLKILGGALVLSDLIHHFLVLWPITGSPHFDVWYP